MSIISRILKNGGDAPSTALALEPGEVKEPVSFPPLNPVETKMLEEEIIATLKTCYDPEIPVDIYELGLIYDIRIDKERFVTIDMTLTSPGCPVAGTLPGDVERKIAKIDGVLGAKIELVWEPTWTMDRMSEEAKLDLGFF
jgi:FeS assembly SUF system protein